MNLIIKETPFGYNISQDQSGRISLTDLWKAANSPKNKSVADWTRLETVKKFIETACRFLNMGKSHVIKKEQGKGGGTFAHEQIALEYAQYLDPNLAIAVNQIFFERIEEEKDPSKAIQRGIETYKRKGKSDKWINERLLSVAARNHFTGTLKDHGVKGTGYKDCTNAIYKPLWGGNASIVRSKLGVSGTVNTREHMTETQLAAVRLSELMASDIIEENRIEGNIECVTVCETASKNIASAIINSKRGCQKYL